MKIRNGFVSNSSSSSFAIPSSFVTNEQQEAIFTCLDDGRKTRIQLQKHYGGAWDEKDLYPSKGLPRNAEYHKIFEDMIENDEWLDYLWGSYYHGEGENTLIMGSCSMWNGSLGIFFERIGIDTSALEIRNHGHMGVHMPTNTEALKIFSVHRQKEIESCDLSKRDYDSRDEDEKFAHDFHLTYNNCEITDDPYLMEDDEFESFGENSLSFDSSDGYSYWKNIEK